MIRFTTRTLLTFLATLAVSINASGADIDPTIPTVALGSDYFATLPGTHYNFGGGIGNVNFMGLPIGPLNTDAIIHRRADAPLDGPPIPSQIVCLSLQTTTPPNVVAPFFHFLLPLYPP